MGVPRPDGFYGNCDPNNIKNISKSDLVNFTTDNFNKLFFN